MKLFIKGKAILILCEVFITTFFPNTDELCSLCTSMCFALLLADLPFTSIRIYFSYILQVNSEINYLLASCFPDFYCIVTGKNSSLHLLYVTFLKCLVWIFSSL